MTIGSHCVAPPAATLPTCTPTWRKRACSAAMARSHARFISFPPPTAIPFTRAIVGFPTFLIASIASMKKPMYFQ